MNKALLYSDINEILLNFSVSLRHHNTTKRIRKTYGNNGDKEYEWFSTFFYPSVRFVIPLPEIKNFTVESVTVRTKLNVSLEVRFQDVQSFTRTFSFDEKAKQTGEKLRINDDENTKGVIKEFYVSFR